MNCPPGTDMGGDTSHATRQPGWMSDDDSKMPEPGEIGYVRNMDEIEAEARRAAAVFGVSPESMVVSRFCYPSFPAMHEGNEDGSDRLFQGMNPVLAGHPAFWLDYQTRPHAPDEDDDLYSIRIWLELVGRDYLQVGTGLVRNVFETAGFDEEDPGFRQMLDNYLNGSVDVEELNNLHLGPGETGDYPPGWAREEAEKLYIAHDETRRAKDEYDDYFFATLLQEYKDIVMALDPALLLAPVHQAIGRLHHTEGDWQYRRACSKLKEAVDRVAKEMDKLGFALAYLRMADAGLGGPASQLLAMNKAEAAQRGVDLESLTTSVEASRGRPDTLKALVHYLETWLGGPLAEARALVDAGVTFPTTEHPPASEGLWTPGGATTKSTLGPPPAQGEDHYAFHAFDAPGA